MNFGDKLSRLIDQSKKTSSEVAREVGVSPTTIGQMKGGHRRPYLDQGARLAKALDVSLDWLADDDADWPPPDTAPKAEELPYEDKMILDIRRALRLSLDDAIRGLALVTDDRKHVEVLARDRDLLASLLRHASPDSLLRLGLPRDAKDLDQLIDQIEQFRLLEEEINEFMELQESGSLPPLEPITEEQRLRWRKIQAALLKRKRSREAPE